MPLYLATFLFLTAASFADLIKRSPRSLIGFLITLYFIAIVGLRYMSVDYESYWKIYDRINGLDELGIFIYRAGDLTPIETGFALGVLAEKLLYGHFFVFTFIFAALSISIKYAAFRRLSPYVSISFLIYFSDEYFWKDMGQIRNAMASGMVLFSFYYVWNRKILSFALLVGLAGFFHAFAWVAAPFYFVRFVADRLRLAAILAGSFVIGAAGGMGLMIPDIADYLGADSTARIIKYTDSRYVGEGRLWGGTSMLHLAISALLILYFDKLSHAWKYNKVLIPIYVSGTALMFVFHDYGLLWGRVRDLLCITTFTVILPTIILLFSGLRRIVPFSIILAYCGLWFYFMMRDREPYQSTLQFLG